MPFCGIFIVRPVSCGDFGFASFCDERFDVAFFSFLSCDQLFIYNSMKANWTNT